jgi:hypothetical protein
MLFVRGVMFVHDVSVRMLFMRCVMLASMRMLFVRRVRIVRDVSVRILFMRYVMLVSVRMLFVRYLMLVHMSLPKVIDEADVVMCDGDEIELWYI